MAENKEHPNAKYYHTKESVEEYIRSARGHDGKQIIATLKKHLPPGSHLLELGSGPGTDWKLLDKHYQVIGSDQSKQFLHHLQTSFPEGEFLELDAASLDTDRLFDGIYSNKVLHHLKFDHLLIQFYKEFEKGDSFLYIGKKKEGISM